MNATITRKITALLAGAAATAGVFTGIVLAAPAQADAAPLSGAKCTTAYTPSRPSSPNPLTRAGQVNAVERAASAQMPAVSCLGH